MNAPFILRILAVLSNIGLACWFIVVSPSVTYKSINVEEKLMRLNAIDSTTDRQYAATQIRFLSGVIMGSNRFIANSGRLVFAVAVLSILATSVDGIARRPRKSDLDTDRKSKSPTDR